MISYATICNHAQPYATRLASMSCTNGATPLHLAAEGANGKMLGCSCTAGHGQLEDVGESYGNLSVAPCGTFVPAFASYVLASLYPEGLRALLLDQLRIIPLMHGRGMIWSSPDKHFLSAWGGLCGLVVWSTLGQDLPSPFDSSGRSKCCR